MDLASELSVLVDKFIEEWTFEYMSDHQLLEMVNYCVSELLLNYSDDVKIVLNSISNNECLPSIPINTILLSVFSGVNSMVSDIELMKRTQIGTIDNKNRTRFRVEDRVVNSIDDVYVPSIIWVLIGLKERGGDRVSGTDWESIQSLYYQLPTIKLLTLLNQDFDLQRKKHSNNKNLEKRHLKDDSTDLNLKRKPIVQQQARKVIEENLHLTAKECIKIIRKDVLSELYKLVDSKDLLEEDGDYGSIPQKTYQRWVQEVIDETRLNRLPKIDSIVKPPTS